MGKPKSQSQSQSQSQKILNAETLRRKERKVKTRRETLITAKELIFKALQKNLWVNY